MRYQGSMCCNRVQNVDGHHTIRDSPSKVQIQTEQGQGQNFFCQFREFPKASSACKSKLNFERRQAQQVASKRGNVATADLCSAGPLQAGTQKHIRKYALGCIRMDLAAFVWTSVPDFAYDDSFLIFRENMQNCRLQTAPYSCKIKKKACNMVARSICDLFIF